MAPPKWRGRLNTLVQLGTIGGIVIANAINIGTNNLLWGWRLSLGLAAVPGTVLVLGNHVHQADFTCLELCLQFAHVHFCEVKVYLDLCTNFCQAHVAVTQYCKLLYACKLTSQSISVLGTGRTETMLKRCTRSICVFSARNGSQRCGQYVDAL